MQNLRRLSIIAQESAHQATKSAWFIGMADLFLPGTSNLRCNRKHQLGLGITTIRI